MDSTTVVWTPYARLHAEAEEDGLFNAVIETPKGSRNKFKYMPDSGLFMLHSVLPAGAVFPFDFGYFPGTLGQDGDPLDVLVFMDQPAFVGCLVKVRLIGVIEAEQTEIDGKSERNDRIIAAADASQDRKNLTDINELSQELLDEITHFFVSYDEMKGKKFRPLGQKGPQQARQLVKDGVKALKKQKKR